MQFKINDTVKTPMGIGKITTYAAGLYEPYGVTFNYVYTGKFSEEDLTLVSNKPLESLNRNPAEQMKDQNKLFVDTDGKPLVIGSAYVDHDGDTCTVFEFNGETVIMYYDKYGYLPWEEADFKNECSSLAPVYNSQVTISEPVDTNVGRKFDSGKPMYNLLPADALEEVVKVLTAGAIKYNESIDQENWRLVSNPQSRYFAAAQRHQWADQRGEYLDIGTEDSPGTGCYHLACAITSLMFKLQLRIEAERSK